MDFELISYTISLAIPLFFLYTEIHYRFPFIFSRYFLKEPEILADIPHRINPNNKLPIMLLIKDADKYPVFINKLNVEIFQNSNLILRNEYSIQTQINDYWWFKTFFIDASN